MGPLSLRCYHFESIPPAVRELGQGVLSWAGAPGLPGTLRSVIQSHRPLLRPVLVLREQWVSRWKVEEGTLGPSFQWVPLP